MEKLPLRLELAGIEPKGDSQWLSVGEFLNFDAAAWSLESKYLGGGKAGGT
jgi:hypothetical protein